jgi:hypothetical protein
MKGLIHRDSQRNARHTWRIVGYVLIFFGQALQERKLAQ